MRCYIALVECNCPYTEDVIFKIKIETHFLLITWYIDICLASQGPTLSGKNEEKAQVLTEKIEALVVQVWLLHVYTGSMNLWFYVKAASCCVIIVFPVYGLLQDEKIMAKILKQTRISVVTTAGHIRLYYRFTAEL